MNVDVLVLSNLAATLFLVGLAWFLQTVHLPLLRRAAAIDFAGCVKAQRARNTALMALPMLIELITGIWLLATPLPHQDVFHAFLLLAIIWIVTLAGIVPLNSHLTHAYDEGALRGLIRWNWIRTLCWTVRAAIMTWITAGRLRIH